MNVELIRPEWSAPAGVQALTSTRRGGVSSGEFAGLNLSEQVGDLPEHVVANRALLRDALALPSEPSWLAQEHGCAVIRAEEVGESRPRADAAVTREGGRVCAVMTADCLPLLLCDEAGLVVAAVHAGWRGLMTGVVEAAVRALQTPPELVHAWLGPAIGPGAFEVGPEVREQFCARSARAEQAFVAGMHGRWLANLYLLARQRLASSGVHRVTGGDYCTFADSERFFSYRRDGRTGRMASLIWIEPGER